MKAFKRLTSFLLCAVMVFALVPTVTIAASAVTAASLGLTQNGEGQYQISSVEDWIKLGTVTEFHGETFIQTNNLDFSGYTADDSNNYLMVGSQKSYPFSATYNGNGYAVKGLSITREGYVGLFGYIKGATIQNLTVTESSFTTTQSNGYIGGIAGSSLGKNGVSDKNTIQNCTITESVSIYGTGSSVRMGGIVGDAAHSSPNYNQVLEISGCNAAARLYVPNGSGNGSLFIGGIIGISSFSTGSSSYANDITIRKCVSTVVITATLEGTGHVCVGGIAGEINPTFSEISGCYSAPTVHITRASASATNIGVGGLVGTFNRSHAAGSFVLTQALTNCHADMTFTLTGGGSIPTGAVIGTIHGTTNNDSVTLTGVTYGSASYTQSAIGEGTAYASYQTSAADDLKAVGSPSIKVNSATLTLDGGIGLTYDLTYNLAADSAVFTNVKLAASTPAGDGVYTANGSKLSVSVPASAYDVPFTVQLQFTYNGKEITLSGASASVADLIYSMLNGENAADVAQINAEIARLLSGMQQYGEYAKAYFAGETLAANAVISAVTETQLCAHPTVINGTQEGLTYCGSSLVLEGTTTVRHYFTLTDGKKLSDLTFLLNGSTVSPKSKANGLYYIEVTDILAQELDEKHIVQLGGMTLSYCALSYANAMVNAKDTDPNVTDGLMNAVKALYLYNQAAEMQFDGVAAENASSEWLLNTVPTYETTGQLSSTTYDTGAMITDWKGEAVNEMQLISSTNAAQFASYISKLQSFGFVIEEDTTMDSNRYVTLFNGAQRVYTYYTANTNVVRVTVELGTLSADEFSGNSAAAAEGSKATTFYHYGLNRDPGGYNPSGKTDSVYNLSGYGNAGQLTVIKCADDSVIIVDGGSSQQMLGYSKDGEPMAHFNEFLHEITGKAEDETVTISCWYLTHADSDHTEGFYRFITAYSDRYDLQRICTNIPAFSSRGTLNKIGAFVRSKYPNCKEFKIHTGQSVTISDVTLQALYTHEDNVNATTAVSKIDGDNNNGALTMKISTANMSMLVTGDINTKAETVLCNSFTCATLGVDIVQTPHHGFNNMTTLYTLTNASYALFTQSQYGLVKPEADSDMTDNEPSAVYASFAANSPAGIREFYEVYYCNTASTSENDKLILATTDLSLIRDDPAQVPAYYQTYVWGFSYSPSEGTVVQSETYVHVFANSK